MPDQMLLCLSIKTMKIVNNKKQFAFRNGRQLCGCDSFFNYLETRFKLNLL